MEVLGYGMHQSNICTKSGIRISPLCNQRGAILPSPYMHLMCQSPEVPIQQHKLEQHVESEVRGLKSIHHVQNKS